jgi:hypothetical protein
VMHSNCDESGFLYQNMVRNKMKFFLSIVLKNTNHLERILKNMELV